jgi:hypothetical protein
MHGPVIKFAIQKPCNENPYISWPPIHTPNITVSMFLRVIHNLKKRIVFQANGGLIAIYFETNQNIVQSKHNNTLNNVHFAMGVKPGH